MTFVTAQLAMQIAILSTATVHTDTYRDAYQKAESHKQPLLVLVGAETSQDCQTMKAENMPALKRDGSLNEIAYAVVDSDNHPKLAQLLTQGELLPQLVLYTRVRDQWRRSQMNGANSPDQIRQFVAREVSRSKELETIATQQVQWSGSAVSS